MVRGNLQVHTYQWGVEQTRHRASGYPCPILAHPLRLLCPTHGLVNTSSRPSSNSALRFFRTVLDHPRGFSTDTTRYTFTGPEKIRGNVGKVERCFLEGVLEGRRATIHSPSQGRSLMKIRLGPSRCLQLLEGLRSSSHSAALRERDFRE